MPRFELTTFGETLIRLSVPAGYRLETAASLDVRVGGSETNVACVLAQLGRRCGWVSALPSTPMGRRVQHSLRSCDLDLSAVVWRKSGRVGTYYVEYAHPPRSTTVHYDRAHSCFAGLQPDEIDWDYLLDTRHLHLSGVTIPLSDSARIIVRRALEIAADRRISTSFDVNFRSRLWSPAEAGEAIREILRPGVDILYLSERDARNLFGCTGTPDKVALALLGRFRADHVVVTLGENGVIGGCKEDLHHVAAREVGIVDRVGAGDAMMAGILHGWLNGSLATGLEYGVVLAALAMSQHGDIVRTDAEELDRLVQERDARIIR